MIPMSAKSHLLTPLFIIALFASGSIAHATLVSITNVTGANAAIITNTPPNPIAQDPNDGILLAWNEVQNFTLTEDLLVDRVFDESASFVEKISNSEYKIKAGTIVSSHYLQWDPGNGSSASVSATIELDSQVFAFITEDKNLFASDPFLGLPGLDYADFKLRGLENGDITSFNGPNVDINWSAGSPGDWTRLITAFSPTAVIPEPSTVALAGLGLLGGFLFWRKQRKA